MNENLDVRQLVLEAAALGAIGDPRPTVTTSRLLALRAKRHSFVPGLTLVG